MDREQREGGEEGEEEEEEEEEEKEEEEEEESCRKCRSSRRLGGKWPVVYCVIMLEDDPLAGPTRRADSSDRCCSTTANDVILRLAVIKAEGVGEVIVVEGIARQQTTKENTVTKGRLA